MLTDQQIEKLKPLCNHPRFGKLLSDAIKVWKEPDVQISCKGFGVYLNLSEVYSFDNDNKQCCLIGAAILGKSSHVSMKVFCNMEYSMSEQDYDDLWLGFDSRTDLKINDYEVWKFGYNVRQIVNPMLFK